VDDVKDELENGKNRTSRACRAVLAEAEPPKAWLGLGARALGIWG